MMRLKGVGTDIVKVERIKNMFIRYGERFLERILTVREFEETTANGLNYESLAGKFAGKEAVIKCLKIPFNPKAVEILHGKNGSPVVTSHKNVLISISHEKDYAVAFAVSTEEEE